MQRNHGKLDEAGGEADAAIDVGKTVRAEDHRLQRPDGVTHEGPVKRGATVPLRQVTVVSVGYGRHHEFAGGRIEEVDGGAFALRRFRRNELHLAAQAVQLVRFPRPRNRSDGFQLTSEISLHHYPPTSSRHPRRKSRWSDAPFELVPSHQRLLCSGKATSMASGKPLSPSQHAMQRFL